MKILRGRTALVTGAASGIGRAIAERLAREGVHLVLTDRDGTGLDVTCASVARSGVDVRSFVCDLTKPAEITQALGAHVTGGALHILVNCAGVTWYGRQHAMNDAAWRDVMAVNLMAPMQITTELMGTLLVADEAHIVNIASILGLVPGRKLAAYSASKYGLVGFSLALRSDYIRSGFGISVICPGFVRTPMLALENAREDSASLPKIPDWLATTAERVAESALDAIRRDRGLVTVSLSARVLWSLGRHAPRLLDFLNREGWRTRGRLMPFASDE